MTLKFIFIFVFIFVSQVFAKTIQFQKNWSLAAGFKIDGLKVGGLSGCVRKNDHVYFISDDRGGEGGARIISFSWDAVKNELDLSSGQVLKIKNTNTKKILDLEGIGLNSKNEFLVSNEGDLNKKPRQGPEIFWLDMTGRRLRDIQLPSEFLPNLSGQQTKGIQNNLGFEGLNVDQGLQKWGAFLEGPLLTAENQAADHLVMIESELENLKVSRQYTYPLPQYEGSGLSVTMGLTDFVYESLDQLLILERGASLSMQGLLFNAQLCTGEKSKTEINRKCSYVFNSDPTLLKAITKVPNLEGLCWMNEKKTQFLVVSDNNFSKSENTVFLLYNLN